MIIGLLVLSSCHREQTYFDTQTQFAEDLNYRLGKWYSVTDSGTTSQSRNTNLDTIWFINDTLAGWTGFGGNPYSFFKTYISPKSIYNMVYIAPDQITTGKMDTCVHQFGFSGDTLTLFWNFTTSPPQVERYVKKIN
jgi:hypothetical protein